ncbi:MAG TPA: ATP-grasp domain-containing protein [Candidatus Tectomicrobia bacterium]|jgi:biotin carboxylase
MPRLLLLMTTTTYRAHDFLEAARRLSIDAVVGSDRPQALADLTPGRTLALDFLHSEAAAKAIVTFARERPLDAIVAVDDDGVLLAATASQALGLAHNSVASVHAARNKHHMRQILAAAGLPVPRFWCFSTAARPADAARAVQFPCVVKPLCLSASRGVMRANNPTQFVAAFQRLNALLHMPDVLARGGALAHQILVETFIPGQEVALEGLLIHGELRVLALFDKPDPLDGPFFEETLYVTPSRLPTTVQEAIAACTARTARALGLQQGPIHAELRINNAGPWVLEVAARTIGGLCSRTLQFGPGLSLEELVLQQALGIDPTAHARDERAAGVMMLPIPHGGILRAVHGQEEARRIPDVEDLSITIPLGQEVVPLPEGARYLGFLFARAATPEQVEAALRAAHKRLELVITPPEEGS